jgi:TetR/AcrR family transcriptional regulator, regulator of cefoperazone and chloramphenicol sensitivity
MSASITHFRPGTNQRGEETRGRILVAALELFAENGFDGASTRAIAERASVNLPAIQYYFGSKEGLYRAIVEQFSQHMRPAFMPVAERIRAALGDDATPRALLIDLIADMVDVVIALILEDGPPSRECRQKFFARMEVEPNAAVEAMQDEMMCHVSEPMCAVIGRLIGRAHNDEVVLLHAMTIIGEAKIFCGWGTGRVLRWDEITEDRVRSAQSVVRQHIRSMFATAPGESP